MERRDFDAQFDAFLGNANIPWDTLPDTTNLNECLHDFEVIDVYGSLTAGNDGKAQKNRVMVSLRVLAPADAIGAIHDEGFTVGTDADPRAQNVLTWESKNNFGAVNLTKLRKHLGAPNPKAMIGGRFSAYTRNAQLGDRLFTNLITTAFYAIGTVPPGTTTAPAPARGRMRAGAATPGNGPQSSVSSSASMACPLCHVEMPVAELQVHVGNCDGTPPPSADEAIAK